MNRYIEANALAHKVAISSDADFINKVTKLMIDTPSIDIVRCKECKHKDEIVNYCYENDRDVNADDFCSYGERKSDEH